MFSPLIKAILVGKKYKYYLTVILICIRIVKSLSHVQLCDPVDCSLPGFSIHGIFQARIVEWVSIFFPRGSRVQSLGLEDPLEKGMATPSSILFFFFFIKLKLLLLNISYHIPYNKSKSSYQYRIFLCISIAFTYFLFFFFFSVY